MYEDLANTRAYWSLELAKMRRTQPRRPSVTARLVNSLSDRDRVDLWNFFEKVDRVAGDPVTLRNMRRAAERHPVGPLRLLVLGAIDSHLNGRTSSLAETRQRRQGRRTYLEVRPPADIVSVR